MRAFVGVVFALFLLPISIGQAQNQAVTGGQTSVALDFETLETVGLFFEEPSPDVIVPGSLPESVAFGINSDTTFVYTLSGLDPFAGSIEHDGSLFFDLNDVGIEVGDFSIGFDPLRVDGEISGFFVESTVGVQAILFDIDLTEPLDFSANLTIGGDLLVSPEFNDILGANVAGFDVGDALIQATTSAIPEPASLSFLAVTSCAIFARRRRRA